MNKRAFALLSEMKDSYDEDLPKLFIIGGMNVQTNEHVKEVERSIRTMKKRKADASVIHYHISDTLNS